MNHEQIHHAQQRELTPPLFYVLYIAEVGARAVYLGNVAKGYRSSSFEVEAYENAADLRYLHGRRRFAMWRRGG